MAADFFKKREKTTVVLPGPSSFCEYPGHTFYKHRRRDCLLPTHNDSVLPTRSVCIPPTTRRPLSQYWHSKVEDPSLECCDTRETVTLQKVSLLDIDPLQSGLFFIHGPSRSGKTRLLYDTAAALSLSVVCINPEDFVHNRQIFATTAAKVSGGRTRGDYFERRRLNNEMFIVLIDELEVAVETENTAFMSALVPFMASLAFGVSVVITSTLPITFYPELLKPALPVTICKLDNEDDINRVHFNVQRAYAIRFGRLLSEFDLHHLYVRERANKDLLQSIAMGKRKCGNRSQRLLPSIYSDIDPFVRDDLLRLFEQRMRQR